MTILAILAVVPVGIFLVTRRFLGSWLLSSVVGIIVLWTNMIVLEAKAADSDFDVIFGVAMMMWASVLTIVYAGLLVALKVGKQMSEKVSYVRKVSGTCQERDE